MCIFRSKKTKSIVYMPYPQSVTLLYCYSPCKITIISIIDKYCTLIYIYIYVLVQCSYRMQN